MALRIEVRRGKLGRWRWFLYRDGKYRAGGRVWGYGSRERARRAAKEDFSQAVTIDGEYGEEYAGEREFSD